MFSMKLNVIRDSLRNRRTLELWLIVCFCATINLYREMRYVRIRCVCFEISIEAHQQVKILRLESTAILDGGQGPTAEQFHYNTVAEKHTILLLDERPTC
jgi:hypothetical protein